MSGSARRRRGRAALAALLAGCALAGAAAAAEPEDSRWRRQQAPDPDLANRPQMSADVKERHDEALQLFFEERYAEARQQLDKLFFKRMNPVEQAKIHRVYAYIASAEEKREEARRRFAQAIESGGLYEEAADARFKIAMLWMQEEEWKKASDTLEQWFAEVPEEQRNANSYYILALNYYQQEAYEKALVPARQAVTMTKAPKESWLQLLLGIHLLQKDYEAAIPVLEQLLALYPSLNYFLSLSTVYGALGNYEEAAIPLQLAYEQGLLTEDDHLRRLGQLLLFLNLPYRAAELLDAGLEEKAIEPDAEVLAMLSNSWIAAREYEAAVDPLERAAALSEDGELYVRLAQVHVQRENWDGATDALDKALAKGDLRQPGDAHLLMGIAFYSQQRREEARRWFASAARFESAQEEAHAWLGHIEQELAAQAAQEESAASGG